MLCRVEYQSLKSLKCNSIVMNWRGCLSSFPPKLSGKPFLCSSFNFIFLFLFDINSYLFQKHWEDNNAICYVYYLGGFICAGRLSEALWWKLSALFNWPFQWHWRMSLWYLFDICSCMYASLILMILSFTCFFCAFLWLKIEEIHYVGFLSKLLETKIMQVLRFKHGQVNGPSCENLIKFIFVLIFWIC